MKLKILIVDDSIVYRKALYEASSKTNFVMKLSQYHQEN